jgi:hypothetical protein
LPGRQPAIRTSCARTCFIFRQSGDRCPGRYREPRRLATMPSVPFCRLVASRSAPRVSAPG